MSNLGLKVVTYSRCSTEHHGQNPDVQVHELRRYCAARGWGIVEEIVDHGFSGGTADRPGLKRLLGMVRAREVDGIVVLKLDRLFRSLKHLIGSLEEFEALGVQFCAVKDNVDYSTPAGRLFVQIIGALGEFEKGLARERTLMGLAHARAQGKTLGRPRKHDADEIVRLREQGLSYREIARQTNAPAGTVSRVLRQRARNTPAGETLSGPQKANRNKGGK